MLKQSIIALSLVFGISNTALAAANPITVYYFHGDIRCFTCNKMETYTSEAIADNFKNNKDVIFKVVNFDKEENKLLKAHYGLYTNSVIVADTGRKWKNLDQIWTKAGNEDKFKSYITSEVKEFIGAKK